MEQNNIEQIIQFFRENGVLELFNIEDEDIKFIFTHYPAFWQNNILDEGARLLGEGQSIISVLQSTFVLGVILGYKCWKEEYSDLKFKLVGDEGEDGEIKNE